METNVLSPQKVFHQPQRLSVPLFQRPYVWNEENQWAPLWEDIERLAGRVLLNERPTPHFIGAVVLQQPPNATGSLPERTVIDGQQRLTTLQLLLDALHAELVSVGALQQAVRVELLVRNPDAYCERPGDKFKVFPTNRDREAFAAVMSADRPLNYDALPAEGRIVDAHRFFSIRARSWLSTEGDDGLLDRANAIERTVRELLQLVVIDLSSDENAQEIFETLNARGAQLTAADLIKNLVFQKLIASGADVHREYDENWKQFETGFWETEVSFGRLRYSRSSIFLNHWLVAQTGEEIVAREVFARFKRFVEHDSTAPMPVLLGQLRRSAERYRSFEVAASNFAGELDRVGLFAYRIETLDSDVFKPVVMLLLDPERPPVGQDQLHKALNSLESWLVRRMLVRATTNSYNKIAAELVRALRTDDARSVAGDVTEQFFRSQSAASSYWPDDAELRAELASLAAYTRLQRGRLRMVLEALEDHRRGFHGDKQGLGGQRVARGKLAIEHVMPQKWQTHWAIGERDSDVRNGYVHRLGNLTLLTGRMNASVSNGPWAAKRAALKEHDVLKLNADLLDRAGDRWDEQLISERNDEIANRIIDVWSTPEGHKSSFAGVTQRERRRTTIADLISAGLIEPGTTLYPRRKSASTEVGIVMSDGTIDVAGTRYSSPSGAASALTGGSENGWWFFLLSPTGRKSLSDLWHEYRKAISKDIDTDEDDMPESEEALEGSE